MQILAKTDYGVRLLLELAADTTRPVTCEAVAVAQDIPYRFLKSIVQDLRRAGMVASQRGCEGGYWLAQDADAITIADVIRAVEGEVLTVRGQPVSDLDYGGSAQFLGSLWAAVERQAGELFGTTIGALLAGGVGVAEVTGAAS